MDKWLGKEMILLSPPPRRTVRTSHLVHGSSNLRTYPKRRTAAVNLPVAGVMHQPEIRKVIRAPMMLGHHMVHVDFLPIIKSLVAARTETVLPLGELPRATSRGLCSVPPLAPVVLEGWVIGGMGGGDQPMADDLGPGELPEDPMPLLILKHPAVLSTTDAAPILLGPPPAGFSRVTPLHVADLLPNPKR